MTDLRQISPWVNYYNEVKELFKHDDEINVVLDEKKYILTLYVDNPKKAEALMQLLPVKRQWGEVVLVIRVIPGNESLDTTLDLFREIFEGNSIFSRVVEIPDGMPFSPNYILFKPEIVQYYSDDLGDANGIRTTLYQELAKDVFQDMHDGIYFCTEKIEDGEGS